MTESTELDIKRIIGWVAASISITLIILLPSGFYYSGYRYETEKSIIRAADLSREISQFVFLHPEDWWLQDSRIAGVIETTLNSKETQVLFVNNAGETIYLNKLKSAWPLLVVSEQVYDVNGAVGTLVMTNSLRSLLNRTLLVFIFSLLVGAIVFLVLYILPVRALFASLSKLESIQKHLEREIDNKERALDEAHRLSKKLHAMAMHDSLTGLPNRAMFNNYLNQTLRTAERTGALIAVIMLDLNRFKEVNDTLGHPVGDALLVEVARRATASLRKSDTIARLGGDEFALVAHVNAPEDGEAICHAVLQAIRQPFMIEEFQLSVNTGGSCGIAFYPEHGTSADGLLKKADVAMYAAKKTVDNVSIYDPNMDVNTPERLRLVNQLGGAIDNDELFLLYQPKVDLFNHTVCGVEALVRWQHPQDGLIPPDEFIPWAEESDVIHPLTDWVIESALKQHEIWRHKGLDIDMCVNISSFNLRHHQFHEKVEAAIKKWHMPSHRLVLEVTERAMIDDTAEAQQILNHLHEHGVRIAIDDFGTGHASLIQLKNFPFSELKVDRRFVGTMIADSNDAAIVNSAFALARSLRMTTTAEGIEDSDTLDLLKLMNCDLAQGYHICPPLTADQLPRWIQRYTETSISH